MWWSADPDLRGALGVGSRGAVGAPNSQSLQSDEAADSPPHRELSQGIPGRAERLGQLTPEGLLSLLWTVWFPVPPCAGWTALVIILPHMLW